MERIRKPPKILVVDDRESERIILSKILSKFHAQVISVSSGQEALSQLIRHEIVLVLLDMQMPIMDGLETAQLMRSNERTKNIPIIFLTAYDKDEITMLQGYKVGAIDYLFKPINKEILLSKVQTFLRAYSFEKEKEYEKILTELESKNSKLVIARKKAEKMMKDANASRKVAEESQQQIQTQTSDLLRYTRELEQFAYVATHDIRAPMINLNGLMNVFRKRGYVTEQNKDVVNRIFKSLDRLNTTLNDLIEVVSSRKSNNLPAKELDFKHVITLILKDLETEIRAKKVKINLALKRENICYIHYQLRSILQNMIVNAIKYQGQNKQPKIKIETYEENGFIHILVSDNGIGIPEDQAEKVFGLFQRLDTTEEGKGMGLYIIKSQIESMGGNITFRSTPGEGTVFHVQLKEMDKES